jgi:hypothetical protein
MKQIIDFKLITEVLTKDKTGQSKREKSYTDYLVGEVKSVTQTEFYKADEAGIRPQCVIVMSVFDYESDATKVLLGSKEYSIYRTYQTGTDRIELYVGERVGNG